MAPGRDIRRVSALPGSRPLLVWDGKCGFCRRWIRRCQLMTGDRVEYAAFQDVAAQFPEIPLEEFASSVQLIETDGRVSRGAEAVFRALAVAPAWRWMYWCYLHVPGVAVMSESLYRFVASHRLCWPQGERRHTRDD